MTLNTRTSHPPKNSPIDCGGVELTNAKFHMVPISISQCMCINNTELKYAFETKQERITISILYHLTHHHTVYPKKYAHGLCFAVLCCGYTLTDFPISIRLTSLALWQSDDCPSASKATLMNMDIYFI